MLQPRFTAGSAMSVASRCSLLVPSPPGGIGHALRIPAIVEVRERPINLLEFRWFGDGGK